MFLKRIQKIPIQRLLAGIILVCIVVFIIAYVMENYFGVPACQLCHYERNVFLAAGVIALLCFFLPKHFQRYGVIFLGFIFVMGATLANYHIAIQQHWIPLPSFCNSNDFSAFESVEALREQLLKTPFVRCDQVTWSFFGLSLAAYNALLSFILAGFCWEWAFNRK